MLLSNSVSTIKNVGEQRLKKLNSLGIFSVEDLIEHFPRDYMDRSVSTPVSDIVVGEAAVICGEVVTSENLRRGNKSVTKVTVTDGTGVLELVWFNQPYLKSTFKPKSEFIFIGKAFFKMGRLQMESADYEAVSDKELLSSLRIVPVYPSTDKLSQKMLRTLIKDTLDLVSDQITEFMPEEILEKYGLCGRLYAVRNLHFPENDEAYFEARKRLVFEELFIMQLYLLKVKGFIKDGNGVVFNRLDEQRLLGLMQFSLTGAQKKVVEEIKKDCSGGYVMNRLIQGDVGSGKTAVAMIACFIAIENGFQAALMAPTETLAIQHYKAFTEIFSKLDISVALLSGSLTKKEKDSIKKELLSGKVQMLIGTHALIQDNVVFDNLGIVITDEQHRFGVRQRATLTNKGISPHVLVMTATPIPRTLALILYGDLDISIIDELPPGRQEIDTSAVTAAYHERIYAFIKKQIDSGRQAYIICPMIDESEKLAVTAVMKYAEELKETAFRDYRVGILHGKMKAEEKNSVMADFSVGLVDILVSTTVVEVGINVPNATVMLIENAERFGLSQLHQLRGRVGRGKDKSYCILVTDAKNDVTKQRMAAMVKTGDGFVISELDLKLRGPGEFFGTRQHGLPEMVLANLYKDMDILKLAQEGALTLFSAQNGKYSSVLERRISKKMGNDGKIYL